MPSTRKKWTANSVIGPLFTPLWFPHHLPYFAHRCASSLAAGAGGGLAASIATCPLDVVKTKLQAQRATLGQADYLGISGLYPSTFQSFPFPGPDRVTPLARLVPSDNYTCPIFLTGLRMAQGPSATSYCTMVFGGYTADSGRPSSVTFRRGPSTLPCMTGSRPTSANRLWASTRRSPRLNDSILRRLRRAISLSSASTRGHFTSYRP